MATVRKNPTLVIETADGTQIKASDIMNTLKNIEGAKDGYFNTREKTLYCVCADGSTVSIEMK